MSLGEAHQRRRCLAVRHRRAQGVDHLGKDVTPLGRMALDQLDGAENPHGDGLDQSDGHRVGPGLSRGRPALGDRGVRRRKVASEQRDPGQAKQAVHVVAVVGVATARHRRLEQLSRIGQPAMDECGISGERGGEQLGV